MKIPTRVEFKNELLNAGIRPSVQRLAIYEYVRMSKAHPTAEVVYEALRDELGSLSLTTVYNTLKLYSDAGLVQMLNMDDGLLRYDGDTTVHSHFKCSCCGEIHDLSVKGDYNTWFEGSDDFRITEVQLYLKGLCKKCKNSNN